MKKILICQIIQLVTLWLLPIAQCNSAEGAITILTENAGEQNFVDKDGSIKGHNTDIVREIIKRLGLSCKIKIVPWALGYKMIQEESNTALFSTTRTKERENMFKWVGPLHVSKFAFYGKKDYPGTFKSLAEAKRVEAIGCVKDDIREQILKSEGFSNLYAMHGETANIKLLKMLVKDRLPLIVSSNNVIVLSSDKLGIPIESIKEVFVFKKAYLYIAFSRKTSDSIISEWQNALDQIKKDGTYQKIMEHYVTGRATMTFDSPARGN